MKKILYLLLAVLCTAACSDELIDGTAGPVAAGDPVRVTLGFNSLSFESAFTAGTRSAFGRILSSDGVEAELMETPVPLTRSVEEDRVYGFWVLQFAGTQAVSSLTGKQYYNCPSGAVSSTAVTLTTGTGQQRIVVIANAGSDQAASSSFVKTLTAGSSTYSDLLALNFTASAEQPGYPLYTDKYPNGSGGVAERTLPVMCAFADAVISENMPAIYLSLRRTVSKITIFGITPDESLQTADYPLWQASLVSIPSASYLFPMGRGTTFPGGDAGYIGHQWPETPAPGDYNIPQKTFYLPVNLFPPVAGTTLVERHLKAPVGSTCLQVMGYKIEFNSFDTDREVPIVKRSIVFQIHLGTNFTDDFSIPLNHELTYKVRVKAASEGEGGNTGVTKFVPGYFGGRLVGLDENGRVLDGPGNTAAVQWRFEKKLEVYPQNNRCLMKVANGAGDDVYLGSDTMRWVRQGQVSAVNPVTGNSQDFMNGWRNTKAAGTHFMGPYCTLSASLGYRLENVTNASSSVTYEPYWWYAPAIGQLLGIWIAGAGIISTMSGVEGFWSSTFDNTAKQAYLLTLNGEIQKSDPLADRYHARAVRNID